ncbi:MAG: TIGR03905 family TSCPD domain-containing protein [Oscillibacter sp.]|nr:TIGR03905 family TSCPD domain-containing protein [Oscillibacter sp.]MBD5154237.1 TIGR03905 family TSCPD domain-containing protein [Oscillibacter sp.]MBD5168794.1 TIGR03905 family TSCPD domain-containing protein [Oscillibacter sp.]
MTYTYRTSGTCSSQIDLELEDGIIRSVAFTGGCNGNLKGICSLVKDMPAQEAIGKLQGIQCGFKPTSCPDQLSKALSAALEAEGK